LWVDIIYFLLYINIMGKQWKTAGKLAQAEKKGALFTKLSREIQVATRLGGPHPESNHRLKLALDTARTHSLPKETIKRAISKASKKTPEDQVHEMFYEGFGPWGVAIIVHCLTDNRVRTVSEIRYLFKKHKGNMGDSGSVMWMFDKVCLVLASKAVIASPEEEAIEVGAEDIDIIGTNVLFYGKTEDLNTLKEQLIKKHWTILKADVIYRPKNKILLEKEKKEDLSILIDNFNELPDCKSIYTNTGVEYL